MDVTRPEPCHRSVRVVVQTQNTAKEHSDDLLCRGHWYGTNAGDDRGDAAMRLPPGQRRLNRFPRFGTHLSKPAPAIPADPVIEIRGAVNDDLDVPVRTLDTLPRQEMTADFHCVAGWSATGLRWEGVPFAAFYRAVIEPALTPGAVVTHLGFGGLDGYRSFALIEDVLADGVLIAERLDGRPINSDHGAPVRLVSPAQYGYKSTKHLSRIDVHTLDAPPPGTRLRDVLLRDHPRARVWEEERHGALPAWFIRPLYRALKAPLLAICRRGEGRSLEPPPDSG
jgi:DMSO/TMAO reductase YedYZ molybdopterin-dependent catalytic subunit